MEGAVTIRSPPGTKLSSWKGQVRRAVFRHLPGLRSETHCPARGMGQAVDPPAVGKTLKEDPTIKAVFIQATETSTGVLHPVKEIGALVSAVRNDPGGRWNLSCGCS